MKPTCCGADRGMVGGWFVTKHSLFPMLMPRVSRCVRVAVLSLFATLAHAQNVAGPSVVLYYGANPPVDELAPFDVAVIEPDSGFEPRAHAHAHAAWFAYVSVGEVNPHRPYFKAMPAA